MADLGMISFARHHRGGDDLRGSRLREPHQPGRDGRVGRQRQVPVAQVPVIHRRPSGRGDARHSPSWACSGPSRMTSASAWPSSTPASGLGTSGFLRRVRGHVHPGLRDLRGDPPQGTGGIRRCRHRSGRVRRHHPGRAGHRGRYQPRLVGPMVVLQAFGGVVHHAAAGLYGWLRWTWRRRLALPHRHRPYQARPIGGRRRGRGLRSRFTRGRDGRERRDQQRKMQR